jgi:lysine-specific demethylase 8
MRLPSLPFFYNECMSPGRPAVLTQVIEGWPARSTRPWSNLDYLKAVAGHRTVPVEHGRDYLDEAFDEHLMTFGDFVEQHLQAPPPPPGAPRAYLAQHQLFEQIPALRNDIATPDYCVLSLEDDEEDQRGEGSSGGTKDEEDQGGEDSSGGTNEEDQRGEGSSGGTKDGVRVNAWLGPAGTVSPLHYDRYHNLLAQVVGSKYVRLYAPELGEQLYPQTSGPHTVSSQIIDPDDVDLEQFPRFAAAPYVDVLLSPGECLYIPPRWWHFVESRETSFSVSFWWT